MKVVISLDDAAIRAMVADVLSARLGILVDVSAVDVFNVYGLGGPRIEVEVELPPPGAKP